MYAQAQRSALKVNDNLVDDIVLRVSTPHTRELLQRFNQQAREVGAALLGTSRNSTVVTKVRADLDALTLRSAFSHLPLLHDLEAMMQWAMAQPIAAPPPDNPPAPGIADQVPLPCGCYVSPAIRP